MKTLFFTILLGLMMPVLAAPATKLPSNEWVVPIEGSSKLVVIDGASGQARVAASSANGLVTWKSPVHTVPEVAGVAGGFVGQEGEVIAISSSDANRVVLMEVDATTPHVAEVLPLPHTGPGHLAELGVKATRELLISSVYEDGATDLFSVIGSAGSNPQLLATGSGFKRIDSLQPLYRNATEARVAVGTAFAGKGILFLSQRKNAGVISEMQEVLPIGWKIASCIKGADGRTMVAAYGTGQTAIRFFTLNVSFQGEWSLTQTGNATVPFSSGIGSVMAVSVPGAEDGILVTSFDRTEAAWFRVLNGQTLAQQAHFGSSHPKLRINSLLPIPGVGLMRLESEIRATSSSNFTSFRYAGGQWQEASSGSLPSLLAAQTDFATMFYYDREPFIYESATLLGLQVAPDWTSGAEGAPFPSKILRETYVSAAMGLGNPVAQGVNAPSGAHFLLGNQPSVRLSIAAMAWDEGLLRPSLDFRPVGPGPFPATIEVSALFDSSRHTLYYRRNDETGKWMEWQGSLTVPYSSSWLFYLKDQVTGASGPVVQHAWEIAAKDLNDTDSDGDGVPDYVEMALGLDPFGGADSDGDGVSDLEEILAGSDPTDPDDVPANRVPIATNGGMNWLVTAEDFTRSSPVQIASGETIHAHDLAGALVASGEVAEQVHPVLGAGRFAELSAVDTLGGRELVAISTPVYYSFGAGSGVQRNGREMIRMTGVPMPVAPEINHVPAGDDLQADAAGWVAAARAGYANYQAVAEITEITPHDTLAALLMQAMIYDCLVANGLFGGTVPSIDEFTIFSAREQDSGRVALTRGQMAGLVALGYDFSALERLVKEEVDQVSSLGLRTAARSIYAHHRTLFVGNPNSMMPLPAMREWVESGVLPSSYANAVSETIFADATARIAAIRARCSEAFRPTASWQTEIVAEGSEPKGVVRRSDGVLVALLGRNGEAFSFERGLGVREGSLVAVSGFTDVVSASGHPAMEVVAATFGFLPVESARDSDGNLLDDEWELFFFGEIGNDPYSYPAGSDYTLLEHYLAGTDPRGGGDEPAVTPMDLTPPVVHIQPVPGSYELLFEWPAAYAERIKFGVAASPDLSAGSFAPLAGATVTHLGNGQFRASLPPIPAGQTQHFYRITLALP